MVVMVSRGNNVSDANKVISIADDGLGDLTGLVRDFARIRDWDRFHSPRNLLLALVGEVGELAAEFQWIDDEAVAQQLTKEQMRSGVGSELADILSYLLRLADVLGIDLVAEFKAKIILNESRYPVNRSKGSSAKYTAYE